MTVADFHLSFFYTKYITAQWLPVLGSCRVSDKALLEAADIVNHMLMGRDDIRQALIQGHVRVEVLMPLLVQRRGHDLGFQQRHQAGLYLPYRRDYLYECLDIALWGWDG